MSEGKGNNSQTAIWVALISAFALIVSTLIGKWDFSAASPAVEKTDQPVQNDDSVGSPISKSSRSESSNKQERAVVEAPKPQPKPVENSNNQLFKGQVIDANGQGVAGVEVVCTDCETVGQTTRTDKFGNFTLPYPIKRKHDIHKVHLLLSKDGRSADYYESVGEIATLILPPK